VKRSSLKARTPLRAHARLERRTPLRARRQQVGGAHASRSTKALSRVGTAAQPLVALEGQQENPPMYPKPARRSKAAPAQIKRTWMKPKPPRRIERDKIWQPYSDFVHHPDTPCAGVAAFPGHVCEGAHEQAHVRDMTGIGRKEPANQTIKLCDLLHDEYDGRQKGRHFTGWSLDDKKAWFRKQIAIFHAMASARGIAC